MPAIKQLIGHAFQARAELIKKLAAEDTDTFRIFHGINEGRPGLTIDRYGPQVLIQSFREPLTGPEIDEIKAAVIDGLEVTPSFVYKNRSGKKKGESDARAPLVCKELGVNYLVTGAHQGQDPLLFLDLRAARRFVMQHCRGKTMLNLFAYTCGAATAALAAGASEAWNVDFTQSYLEYGKENAKLNHIRGDRIRFIRQDVFPVVRQLAGLGVKGKARRRAFMHFKPRTFDIVFLDPPTMAKSPFGKVDIIHDYQALFKPALLCVKPGGQIICTNHAPSVNPEEWLEQLNRCAQKANREIKATHIIEPETDFPSPDGKFPLKIATFELAIDLPQ
jgi:23S rRNA (cytosine1962-C5)-methyltransferase